MTLGPNTAEATNLLVGQLRGQDLVLEMRQMVNDDIAEQAERERK